MGHDYQKTEVALYRALYKDNFVGDVGAYLKPDKDLADAAELLPVLHPTFEAQPVANGQTRQPDIVPNRATGLYEPDTGGTSLFDRAGVLKRADGDFLIPAGTDIPPDLKVTPDGYRTRFKATHYLIMPSKPLPKQVLMGQLDNFARNAIRRQWEQARGL